MSADINKQKIKGKLVKVWKTGEAEIPHTVRFIYAVDETFDIGRDTGSPVTDEYKAGAVFTSYVYRTVVEALL